MHPSPLRERAIELRSAGYSYPYISKETGVSKSTLSGWLAGVPFSPNQHTIASFGKSRAAAAERKAITRRQEATQTELNAKEEIGRFTERDLFMLGLGLYMGEGTKTHDIVRVANSDPAIITCLVSWFMQLGVEKSQFSPRIYLYPDSNPGESLLFWSRTTSIPKSQFLTPYIDKRTDKKAKKHNRLPHGTLHLGVRSSGRKEYGVVFSRRILALSRAVLEDIQKRN